MTGAKVSTFLKIHLKTVHKLAEKGITLGTRISRVWRFSRNDVLQLPRSKPSEALSATL
jgi:hypothetical protein